MASYRHRARTPAVRSLASALVVRMPSDAADNPEPMPLRVAARVQVAATVISDYRLAALRALRGWVHGPIVTCSGARLSPLVSMIDAPGYAGQLTGWSARMVGYSYILTPPRVGLHHRQNASWCAAYYHAVIRDIAAGRDHQHNSFNAIEIPAPYPSQWRLYPRPGGIDLDIHETLPDGWWRVQPDAPVATAEGRLMLAHWKSVVAAHNAAYHERARMRPEYVITRANVIAKKINKHIRDQRKTT